QGSANPVPGGLAPVPAPAFPQSPKRPGASPQSPLKQALSEFARALSAFLLPHLRRLRAGQPHAKASPGAGMAYNKRLARRKPSDTAMSEIILVNISGQDKPGLTSSLMSILAEYNVGVLDIGQAM